MTPTQRVQAGKSALSEKFKSSQRGQPGGMSSISSSAKKAAQKNLEKGKAKVQQAIDKGKIPSRGDDDDDDRIAQIYQTATEDQLQRQRRILDSLPKRTGQFANIFQEGSDYKEKLDELGYKVSPSGNSIVDEQGATIAGVTDAGNLFSGSRKVEQILDEYTGDQYKGILTRPGEKTSDEERQEITDEAFKFIEDIGGETSLAQQDKIRRILNRGRGIGVLPSRTGNLRYSSAGGDFGDLFSDIGRGLFGGKAETQVAVPKPVYEPERVQGLVPQVFEAAVEGKFSPIAMGLKALEATYNTAVDGFNKTYDAMNDVQKEIFENKGKYPFAENIPTVRQAEDQSMELLELQKRMNLLENYKRREEFDDYRSRFMDPEMAAEVDPIVQTAPTEDLRGEDYLPPVAYETTDPINVKEKFQTAAENYLDPEAREKALEELRKDDQASLSTADGTQVTAFNNPGNLQFAGQQGAIEGQTYGNNFAVFPNAEVGISALRNDLTAKVNRSNKVDDIIGEYAPKADNPESFNNYVSFVKDRVGETVEPNEIDELTRSVIQFENQPEIANQYLAMVADGGMIDKQLKSLQNGLQNMYNGIPSVKRR